MPSRKTWEHLLSGPLDFAVVTPSYPRSWRHGAEFVRSRVHAYVQTGLRGMVIDFSGKGNATLTTRDSATEIFVTSIGHLSSALQVLEERRVPVLAHSPSPQASQILLQSLPSARLAVWYHGYEVRDYRRLAGNYTTAEYIQQRRSLDALMIERRQAALPIFAHPNVSVVFVSRTQQQNSEWDMGAEAVNAHVIPNHIDTQFFKSRQRQPQEARRILLMRSFGARNYGNDIAIKAISMLRAEPEFPDLEFTVRGFGRLFKEEVSILRGLPNVKIEERYSGRAEMAVLHHDHGVFLCPSRYDTQGVMLGEAMASGMATITNPVAAIPEFTDSSCSLLPRAEDPKAFASAIWHLVTNSEQLPHLSRNAALRVEQQCGYNATIAREIELIGTYQ